MRRSTTQAGTLFLLLVLLASLLSGCDRGSVPTDSAATEPAATSVVAPAAGGGTALSSFTTADFAGPGTCVMCHQGIVDAAGVDVSLTTDWRSTMMANAAKDPVWQAKMSSEVARVPALQEVIEEKCVTCHMPMATTQAQVEGQAVAALGSGFFDPAHPLHAAAMDGVSCTLCHQVTAANLGAADSFTGGFSLDTTTEPPDRLAFGPYEQPFGQPMRMHTGFDPVYGAHTNAAELCATCHNLFTPYVDAQGNVLGEFPEQTPYTEWQNSSFGQGVPCQSCHMPTAEGGVVISTMPGRLGPREPFFQHWFVGGNALMLRILASHGADLGVTADAARFDTTHARVVDQIGQRTARLSVDSLALEGGVLKASLKVAVLTGHKFPTSFPARRAWLHITVADAAGDVIWESGARNPDGTISGNAADTDPAAFEPHYDVIRQPDQVQIYEPIMGNHEGQVTYTLMRAAQYLKDNRILPAGTDKAALPAEVAVYGEAAGDANFVGGSDLVTYEIDLGQASGPFTFSAELFYEPLSHRFIADLLTDGTELTERFGMYYGQADTTPLLVAAIQPVPVE